ncbi:MAG: hypothetical protein IT237_01160 [Bacteroidia bacterium]|nr:hypothetical protein [Bacteroidia bacterium]
MKRKVTIEPDLSVINKKPTKKEIEELREFIKEYKKNQALNKKHRKAA